MLRLGRFKVARTQGENKTAGPICCLQEQTTETLKKERYDFDALSHRKSGVSNACPWA